LFRLQYSAGTHLAEAEYFRFQIVMESTIVDTQSHSAEMWRRTMGVDIQDRQRSIPLRQDASRRVLEPEQIATGGSYLETLFVENDPLSEATRGCVAVLQALGLDTARRRLLPAQLLQGTKDRNVLQAGLRAGRIESCVMTNDPLDPRGCGMERRAFRPILASTPLCVLIRI